jgi:hypothetical protein
MSVYRFVLHGPGAKVEALGALRLTDDTEAVTFGRSVARNCPRAWA